jgi:hypothetical protein
MKTNADISLFVRSNIKPLSDTAIKLGWYKGEHNKKWVMYDRTIFGVNLKLLLRNLNEITEIYASNTVRMLRIDIGDIPSLYSLLDAVTAVKMLMHGYAPLHSSCISIKNKIVLFVAFSNVGKTTIVEQAIRNPFTSFLSEDMTIIDKRGIAYGVPTRMPNRNIVLQRISKIMPIFPLFFPKFFTKDVKEIIPSVKILKSGRVDMIFFLEIGPSRVLEIDADEALQKLISINRENYNHVRNPLLMVYEYFNPSFKLKEVLRIEEDILRNLVSKRHCYIFRASSAESFLDTLKSILDI